MQFDKQKEGLIMTSPSGAQISKKAFIQSTLILLFLMVFAGILTRMVPTGNYLRIEQNGREVIDPTSFKYTERPLVPIWRWFTAPIEVLWGPDSLVIIVIIIFILMVAGAFAVLEKSGILNNMLARIVNAFHGQKYQLLLVITFFFMFMGAFFGLFEEIVPLVPLMIALSYHLGWDAMVGLGMSILATNMGFSAAITNPFTIGVAQKLAELPIFSGFWLRIPIFVLIYILLAVFLVSYAKKIDRTPQKSLLFNEDQTEREKYSTMSIEDLKSSDPKIPRAAVWFMLFLLLIIAVLVSASFISFIADYALPLVGVLFFIGGLGAGLLTSTPSKDILKALWEGILGFLPGVPLILMAASIKHIVASGGVMDTILFNTSTWLSNASPLFAAYLIYMLALLIELFIGSAGAKAILLMPILLPLADLVGVTRQITVTAYCFGDGFSNMAYPTNPVLLITLGLASVGYAKWIRWTALLWLGVLIITVAFLWIATVVNYGPF
jgi:uncharacterized ion transporter superfamily protein YfcC